MQGLDKAMNNLIGGCWWWVGGGEWWRKIASENRLWQTGRRTLSHIELLLQLKRGLLCHNIKISHHYLRVKIKKFLQTVRDYYL